MRRRLLLLVALAAVLALSTASASSLGNLTDVSLHQTIQNDVDPCEHEPSEPDPCPEGFTPYVPAECSGTLDDYTVIVGTDGPDTIIVGPGDADGRNLIFGLGGDDTIHGGNQADCLVGGAGDDTLEGGTQDDVLLGGAGDDTLRGDNGADTLYGEDGDDTLEGGNGGDHLDGGAGTDTCAGGNGPDTYDTSCETTS